MLVAYELAGNQIDMPSSGCAILTHSMKEPLARRTPVPIPSTLSLMSNEVCGRNGGMFMPPLIVQVVCRVLCF